MLLYLLAEERKLFTTVHNAPMKYVKLYLWAINVYLVTVKMLLSSGALRLVPSDI